MARLDVNLRGLFATPVAAVQLPDADIHKTSLRATILARRDNDPGVQASNAGGWHSDRAIESWGGPAAGEILTIARQLATRLTVDRHGQRAAPDWVMQARAHVNGPGDGNICNGPGDGNICHHHPGAFWSGTHYVDDGGCASDPTQGGELEMLDPRSAAPGMYAPASRVAGEEHASAGSAETIRPRPGLLFLFSSWLMHQVRPYRGERLRISLAFNFGL